MMLIASAVPSSLAVRPSYTLRHMLQTDAGAGATVTDPVDVSMAPPGEVTKVNKTVIELQLGELWHLRISKQQPA